jgi:uncharacterized protein (DUF1697 family)
MTVHIALLRAVNVGGHQQVAMADLRDLLTRLGFSGVRSLLQSGNLVFRSDAGAGAQLERTLEAETAKRLGVATDFFVRTAAEWRAVVARNPFREEARRDPGHLVVLFLKDEPDGKDVKALEDAIVGREEVQAVGKQLYAVYPDGQGKSRLTIALIEKKLGTRGTGRNWNTVLKLEALSGG